MYCLVLASNTRIDLLVISVSVVLLLMFCFCFVLFFGLVGCCLASRLGCIILEETRVYIFLFVFDVINGLLYIPLRSSGFHHLSLD